MRDAALGLMTAASRVRAGICPGAGSNGRTLLGTLARAGAFAGQSLSVRLTRASVCASEPNSALAHQPRRRSLRLLALVAVVAAALTIAPGARDATGRRVELQVVVHGYGTVSARPGSRTCRRQCAWPFRVGGTVRLRALPGSGNHFAGWQGACSGRSSCAIRITRPRRVLARFAPNGPSSWSNHVRCTPVLTTLPEILGSQESPAGGAIESGGKFQPHLRGAEDQHLLNPPCTVGATPTFVEVHDVVISAGPSLSRDGDDSANISDPNRPDIANPYMKTLHVEIDGLWISAEVAPRLFPPLGTRIDVQGFVFWDPAHLDAPWHSLSGWELHPISAWRPAAR
jgi:hypothetical protein